MENRRNVLLIHYYFPPIRCVATHRIRNLYDQCLKHFDKVFVSTTTNRRTLPVEKVYSAPYPNVLENLTLDYRTFRRGNRTSFNISKTSGFGAIIFKLVESFPTNIFIGEGGLLYIILSIVNLNRIVKREKIGFILSSYRPFADHYIAYVTKRLSPDVYWIADFRDHPVNLSLGNVYFPRLQRGVNKYLLKKADIVLGVSKGVLDRLPVTSDKHILRNAISAFPSIPEKGRFGKFTIAYTGSVYPHEQNPDPLLEALRSLFEKNIFNESNMQFVHAGPHSDYWKSKFTKYNLLQLFCDYGYLDYQESLMIQSRSHLNLLLNYCDKEISGDLSAKLYEYLRWPNPIIAITNGLPDSELNELFSKTNCGMVFTSDDKHKIEQYLFQLWKISSEGTYQQIRNQDAINALCWENTFAQLMKKIEC